MDVLIRAKRKDVEHKFDKENAYCWWTVNGTPRNCGKGDNIFFSDGERIYGEGDILDVDDGRIIFTPLKRVDLEQPKKPPTRGFTYLQ